MSVLYYPINKSMVPSLIFEKTNIDKDEMSINDQLTEALSEENSEERKSYLDYLNHIWPANTITIREKMILEELVDIMTDCSEKGWDGYDALPISKQAINLVLNLLDVLPKFYPLPNISPEASGNLSFLWEKNNSSLYINIKDDIFSYAGITREGGKYLGVEKINNKNIPIQIINYLKQIYPNEI